MAKKKNNKRRRFDESQQGYTVIDEAAASPLYPAKLDPTLTRGMHARLVVESMRNGQATQEDWRALASLHNLFEVMRDHGFVQDPDDLLGAVAAEMAYAAVAHKLLGEPIGVTPAGYFHLNSMVTDWEEIVATAPERMVIRSLRLANDQRRRQTGRTDPFLSKGYPL